MVAFITATALRQVRIYLSVCETNSKIQSNKQAKQKTKTTTNKQANL
jgi:hypothetical protein